MYGVSQVTHVFKKDSIKTACRQRHYWYTSFFMFYCILIVLCKRNTAKEMFQFFNAENRGISIDRCIVGEWLMKHHVYFIGRCVSYTNFQLGDTQFVESLRITCGKFISKRRTWSRYYQLLSHVDQMGQGIQEWTK